VSQRSGPFRDLNHNGTMEPYEDPGRPAAERVEDLLGRMTVEEKAGLLFHPIITPGPDGSVTEAPRSLSVEAPAADRITGRLVSHFNAVQLRSARETALWHNRLQEAAASTRLGIPVTLSSDPVHSSRSIPGATWHVDAFSQWPDPIGLAAIGDASTVERFGDIARREYLAVGIRVALHPQADLATEPRWARINATFGEDAELASGLVAAYVRGFQGGTLGPSSVATMLKHFPGGGPQRDGEDPHFEYGREQVYPGGNFDYHLRPFEAGFAAGTSQVMPYYGMPVGTQYEEVGFGFNRAVITGLLREKYGFDGIVCTDWGIVSDTEFAGTPFPARAWGAEQLSREERILKILDAGVDQFGGEECPEIIVGLVASGALTQARLDVSARRILREKFVLGLFDDPFVDAEAAPRIVGSPEFREAGLAAQRASLTLLKNEPAAGPGTTGVLPLREGTRVYLRGVDAEVAADYAEVTTDPGDAAFAVVRIDAAYEPREGALERFFHAGRLAYPAEFLGQLLPLLDRVPTIVVVHLERPVVLPEIARRAAALVGSFGASDRAVLDVLFGRDQPRGKLPFDLPSSMDAVLAQRPDVPFDTPDPLYTFGHGLSYEQSGRNSVRK
jgi:beta-glucosidase